MDGRTDRRSLADRLRGKFEQRGPDECWPWIAASDPRGYGRITVKGSCRLATHVILEASGRPRPPAPNDQALHRPDCHGSCSNPKHLRWGSQKQNMEDKVLRGTSRHKPGTFIGAKSTITEQDVRDIRISSLTLKDLAELYDMSERSVWDIKKRRSWSWVSD